MEKLFIFFYRIWKARDAIHIVHKFSNTTNENVWTNEYILLDKNRGLEDDIIK
jgi:hypothetical protein